MNRLPGSQLLESNAGPATRRREEASMATSVLLSAASIEPLAPPAQQHRRSSNISFERHTFSLFEDLAAELDLEDDDDDSDTESETESGDDADSVNSVNPAAARPGEDAINHPRQGRLLDAAPIRRPSRRLSELSLDLEDIREAVAELEDKADEEEDNEDSNHHSRFSCRSLFSSSNNNNMSIVGRAEDEILARAVREGKLLVTYDDNGETTAPAARGHGSTLGHSVLSGRSWGSSSTSWSRRRRVSFTNGTARTSASAPRSGGHVVASTTGACGSIQDGILTALRELQADDNVERQGPPPVDKAENEKEEGPEQGDDDDASPRRPLTLELREVASPPPRETRPRRSSLRRTEDCVY